MTETSPLSLRLHGNLVGPDLIVKRFPPYFGMPLSDPISNEALLRSDVPPTGADWSHVVKFAQTFNGYVEMGSRARCAEVANHRKSGETLSELRACLFFEYRRHNHFGYPPDETRMQYIYELLDQIREQARVN